jgi:restriction system protein
MGTNDAGELGSKGSDVMAAFDILLEIIEDAVAAANRASVASMQSEDYDLARKHLDRSEAITHFRDKVTTLRDEWFAVTNLGTEEIDDAQQTDSLFRRNLRRLPRGIRTPESAFTKPILEALVELGGSAPVSNVLDLVEPQLKSKLKDVDYQSLPSDPNTLRWRNTAQWARHDLVNQGFLKNDSPRGIWEITEKGRQWLNNVQDLA